MPSTLAQDVGQISGLARYGGNLLWIAPERDAISSLNIEGGTATTYGRGYDRLRKIAVGAGFPSGTFMLAGDNSVSGGGSTAWAGSAAGHTFGTVNDIAVVSLTDVFLAVDDAGVLLVESAGAMPMVMAAGGHPNSIAADETRVYWTDSVANTVSTVLADGARKMMLASGQKQARAIQARSGTAYWLSAERDLMKASTAGGMPTLLAADFAEVFTIGVSYAFGMSAGTGALVRVPLGGGTVSTFAAVSQPIAIVADDSFVFWVERDDGTGKNVLRRLHQDDAHP